MEYQFILYNVSEKIATITLNRPKQLNALNAAVKQELKDAVAEAVADNDVRVIVLTGTGKAFSAGNDLQDNYASPPKCMEDWRTRLHREIQFCLTFWDCPKPVIAAVNGYCLASASEMAMSCDITIAAQSAVFGEPEVRQVSGPPMLLAPWIMGSKRAKEMLLTGNMVSAEIAEKYGMVNHVVPDDKLMAFTYRMARKIAAIDPFAVKISKYTINRAFDIMGFKTALQVNSDLMAIVNNEETDEIKWFKQTAKEKGFKEANSARLMKFKKLDDLDKEPL
ncbi:MAG: enoyl-CoA hydratase/isomerase family protein [Desulfobacteraceae bacterium]|nr:enoyl-CoA hydratase/isomerase family protein [Desulfobacteraceae bacterium]